MKNIKENHEPAYGMIPFMGGRYSITFKKNKSGQPCILTGHGNFPFEEYPGIPIIDFRDNFKAFEYLRWGIKIEETDIITDYDRSIPGRVITLSKFLQKIKGLGVLMS